MEWGFLGVNVWSRDFLGFCWKPEGFFGVLIFAPIRSSPSLEIPSTPLPPPPGHINTYSNLNDDKDNKVLGANLPHLNTEDFCISLDKSLVKAVHTTNTAH